MSCKEENKIIVLNICKKVKEASRERERLYFTNRHFADLAELRDLTRLIIVIVKIPIKSNETI